jgi:hypothetical protein
LGPSCKQISVQQPIPDDQEWLSQLVSQKDFKAAVMSASSSSTATTKLSSSSATNPLKQKETTAPSTTSVPKPTSGFTLESLLKQPSGGDPAAKPKVIKKTTPAGGDKDVKGFFEALLKK